MDNLRLVLWFGLAVFLWLNYTAYTQDHRPPAPAAPSASAPQQAPQQAPQNAAPQGAPAAGQQAAAPPAEAPSSNPNAVAPFAVPRTPTAPIRVRTDVLDVLIDTHGGNIVRVNLPAYPVHKNQPDIPVRLLDYKPDDLWALQSGLERTGDSAEPDDGANYRASAKEYTLAPGQDKLVVRLDWIGGDSGVGASKVYTFTRGSYAIGLDMKLDNDSGKPWQVTAYAQMVRRHSKVKRHIGNIDTYSYRGAVLYNGDHYKKLKLDELQKTPVSETLRGGWFAGIEHHFVAAVVPPLTENIRYEATAMGEDWAVGARTPVTTVGPGQQQSFPYTLFIGPKLQNQLAATAPNLQLTVDYGVLGVLARPLFWLLAHVERVTGNWGWAIILVTMFIKLVFYKLTETSGRSMAKMRRLAPRIKAVQERFKDDRQAQSQAMMELYRKEKVNPAAGCLPMIIQMPFFFAFYWVLIESVEMRQAPFMLWINDLSARDPYFVLPILNGIVMFVQSRLNPPPPDPMQARMMQFMPIAFAVFFAFFPSGLVLYYLTNTTLGILQQWRINKIVAAETATAT